MNYRHAFHAGNFADVVKHVVFVAVLRHLARKDKGFCVIDTHAGAGLYDLTGEDSCRTGEAGRGIRRLSALPLGIAVPAVLSTFLDCARVERGGLFPGSARLAARLLRPQDRLIAIEKNPTEATQLRQALSEFRNARAVEADGHARLPTLLPPRERRGVVLIDPPYEEPDEFGRVVELLALAYRRFASGVYLLWYPIKSRGDADAFAGEVATRVSAPLTRVEIDTGRTFRSEKERLSAAGVLIVNPPYGFDEEMTQAVSILAPLLGHDPAHPADIAIFSPRVEVGRTRSRQ